MTALIGGFFICKSYSENFDQIPQIQNHLINSDSVMRLGKACCIGQWFVEKEVITTRRNEKAYGIK